jgi:hypothetical protein
MTALNAPGSLLSSPIVKSGRGRSRARTSVEEETNDYAIVRPPSRSPLFVAAYYDAPSVEMEHRESGHVFV